LYLLEKERGRLKREGDERALSQVVRNLSKDGGGQTSMEKKKKDLNDTPFWLAGKIGNPKNCPKKSLEEETRERHVRTR